MNNYYNKFYDKEGKRLAKGDIVYNAKGDIVGAKGDIVGAKGDIVGAKGDIVGATGDILSACGAGDEWDWETGEFCESYTNPESTTETTKDGTKLFNVLDHVFGYADQTATLVDRFKNGTTVEQPGVDYSVKPGGASAEKDMKMWYVAGGVIVVVVVGALLIKKSK